MVKKVVQNAPDAWCLIYLALRGLHTRSDQLDIMAPFLPNNLPSSSEQEVFELSKEALDTALVPQSLFTLSTFSLHGAADLDVLQFNISFQ
jgi:hypothetical protein